MGVFESLMQIPAIGKFTLEKLKANAFNSFQIPLEKVLENQTRILNYKLDRLENTSIGKKLGINGKTNFKDLPYTDYNFYAPFYNNPSPDAFMYPLEEYITIKTSGTTGKNKSFLIPRIALKKVLRQTALPVICALFHDGEKIALEYGDTFYLNVGPAPYLSGTMFNMGSQEKTVPFLKLTPNINLTYKEKVDYFILNRKKINAAWLMASTLITQIIPQIKEPIKLKGLILMDDLVARTHKEEITKFTGTTPKTLYASTETVSPSIPSVQHSMGFIFDPRRGIFEFIPYENNDKNQEEPVGLNEVQVGKIYRLIYTDLVGELTRYDTTNSFKCMAKSDDIINTDFPVFQYHSRLDATLSIMNFTRIGETELLEAFRAIGIKIVEFTTKLRTEGGHEYIQIYIELIDEKSKRQLEEKIHQYLYTHNTDYKTLSDSFSYIPIKLTPLPKNTFAKYLENKSGSIPKVCRIGISDDELDKLLSVHSSSTAVGS